MTPKEIAAKLTEAQVRALRVYENGSEQAQYELFHLGLRYAFSGSITTLGREVLACLDGEAQG